MEKTGLGSSCLAIEIILGFTLISFLLVHDRYNHGLFKSLNAPVVR